MGQLVFIFCAAVAFWVVKDGVEEIGILAETVVPLIAELGPALLESKSSLIQGYLMELLSTDLF